MKIVAAGGMCIRTTNNGLDRNAYNFALSMQNDNKPVLAEAEAHTSEHWRHDYKRGYYWLALQLRRALPRGPL